MENDRHCCTEIFSFQIGNHLPLGLNPDPLDFIKGRPVTAPVVKPGGPRRFVSCHLLIDLQPPAILQIRRDARRPKGVASNLSLDSCRKRSSANHLPHIGLEEGIAG